LFFGCVLYLHCSVFLSFFLSSVPYSICIQCSLQDRLCNMQSLIQLSQFLSPRDNAVSIRRLWKRSAVRRLCQIERWLCVNIFVFIVMFMSAELRFAEHCIHDHRFFLQCTAFIYSSTIILCKINFVNLPAMVTNVETSVQTL